MKGARVAAVMLVLACASMSTAARGQTRPDAGGGEKRLVVGAMRAPPFAMRGDDGRWTGLSIELWQQIAAELKLDYEMREYDYDLTGLLRALEGRQLDIAAIALPVTAESESRFDFSHPYLTAGLGIAVRADPQRGVLPIVAGLATYQVGATLGGLAALLVSVGALVWFVERRRNPQFDQRPVQGIGDGLWWAAVTMTTTGYGDKAPVTTRGRLLALVWMFASIFFIAVFSATLASSFVVGRLKTGITGPADLPRARLAVVPGTAGEQWLELEGLTARRYPFVIQASKALRRGEVEALIFERPILAYLFKEYGWKDLVLLPHVVAERDYAFALPPDSALRERVNLALLKVVQRREWRDAVQRYLGRPEPQP